MEELEAAVDHVEEQALKICIEDNDTYSGNHEDKIDVIEEILAYMILMCFVVISDSSNRASWFYRHVFHVCAHSHVWIGRPPESMAQVTTAPCKKETISHPLAGSTLFLHSQHT